MSSNDDQTVLNDFQAVRPKVRATLKRIEMKLNHEPIETKYVKMYDLCGKLISVPLISKEFSLKMNGIDYKEPTFSDLSSDNLQLYKKMWLLGLKKMESLLTYLISLPYFRFWSTIAYNKDIQATLESYLLSSSPSYRIHPVCKDKNCKPLIANVHILVFKVYVRCLLPKESEANFMTDTYHRDLLLSTGNLVSPSNIINLIHLFGYGFGSHFICLLLQPFIRQNIDSFKYVIEELIKILENFNEKDLTDDHSLESIANRFQIISSITDMLFSLNKLHFIEPKLMMIYKECNLIEKLISFYGRFFHSAEQNLQNLSNLNYPAETMCNCMKSQLKLSQSCALLLVHHQIKKTMFQSMFEPVGPGEDKYQPFDMVIHTLNLITEEKNFCYDYFTTFSFEKEFASLMIDEALNVEFNVREILNHFKQMIDLIIDEMTKQRKNRFGNNNNSNNNALSLNLQYTPPESNQNQSNQELTELPDSLNDCSLQKIDEHNIRFDTEVIMKEKEIGELFPHLGDGYIYKCLEYYNFDIEVTVDAMLTKNLPPEIDSLSTDLQKSDLVRARRNVLNNPNPSPADWPVIDRFDPSSIKVMPFIEIGNANALKKPNKSEINKRTIELASRISNEEEENAENIKWLLERGKLDKNELKTNINYIAFSHLYDDDFDDTYENNEKVDVHSLLEDNFVDQESDVNGNKAEDIDDNHQVNTDLINHFRHFNPEKRNNAQQNSKNKFYNKREYNRKQHNAHSSQPTQSNSKVAGGNPLMNKNNNDHFSQNDRFPTDKQQGGNNRNGSNGSNSGNNSNNNNNNNSNNSSNRPNQTKRNNHRPHHHVVRSYHK